MIALYFRRSLAAPLGEPRHPAPSPQRGAPPERLPRASRAHAARRAAFKSTRLTAGAQPRRRKQHAIWGTRREVPEFPAGESIPRPCPRAGGVRQDPFSPGHRQCPRARSLASPSISCAVGIQAAFRVGAAEKRFRTPLLCRRDGWPLPRHGGESAQCDRHYTTTTTPALVAAATTAASATPSCS